MKEEVILVDAEDNPIGVMDKIAVHQKGLLHRAFSIFLYNDKNELLLQKRALAKYHSGGLWTNTCCSHPRPGESLEKATARRLKEEMGIVCDLEPVFEFKYKVEFENGLIEHEYDHVFWGKYNDNPEIEKEEVADWKYMSIKDIELELRENPGRYTAWFRTAFPKIKSLV